MFALFIIASLGIFVIHSINEVLENRDLEQRFVQLKKESEIAAAQFQAGIENYAVLVAGLRSHIENSPQPPTYKHLQQFLKTQYESQAKPDSIILSFLDTNNVFQYSITHNAASTNQLVGTSVDSLRSEESTSKMKNELRYSDDLYLFQPINLVEGWVGFSLCFRLVVDDVVQGFFAPNINFESIIKDLYDDGKSTDFVFRFSTNDGLAFDRTAVYDGSKIYNTRKDQESFTLFGLEDEDFESSSFSVYGNQFKVEVAYKKPYAQNSLITFTLFGWLLCLILIIAISLFYWKMLLDKNDQLLKKNDELSSANEGLKNFAIASSHDLKEPLRSIGSFSSLLKRRYYLELDENGKSYIDYIVNGAIQMNNLLNDLLEYSKIIHKNDFPKEEVNLYQIIKDVECSLESSIRENNVTIQIDDLPSIQSSPSYMHQLFQNFISNAIKFNDKVTPEILIGSRQEKDHTLFFVKDNGIGIKDNYHEKIFEVFQRLSRDNNGTGIGLTICKKIIEQHEGKLWVESEEGEGATFYFRLPLNN